MPTSNPVLSKTLRLVKLFAGFTEQDALEFARIARRYDAHPGEAVIREGDCGKDAYIVASGRLRVVKSCDGTEQALATLEAGDTFGELALLDSGPRSASVIAETAATLLRFERASLATIPHVLAKVLGNVTKLMANRLRATSIDAVVARVTLARSAEQPETAQPAQSRVHLTRSVGR